MKKVLFLGASLVVICALNGCQTVETLHAPADAYNIRKPADTTKPVRQTDTTIIEVK